MSTTSFRTRTSACAVLGTGVFVASGLAQGPDPITISERSEFQETGRYDDVVAFMRQLDEQSESLHLTSLGQSFEGRDLPLAIIADPPVENASQARSDERMTVLLFGNIHAGEVCGKEALQMLARELVQTPDHPLLEHLIVAIVPIYNADGNELFSPDNRPGQVGPREMGQRANLMGLDLNRDWIKLEAPETQAMVRFFNQWDPLVVVDTHTTNGSLHRYTLTYQGPLHPAGDPRLVEFVRDDMMPAISNDLLSRTGYRTQIYGNLSRDRSFWWTHPGQPRFGAVYRGMRNRIGILSEAYSYASYEDRIRSTLEFCRSILTYASQHHAQIKSLIQRIDERTVSRGTSPQPYDTIAVRSAVRAMPEKATILGYERSRSVHRDDPGAEADHIVDFVNDFYGTRFAPLPFAYVIPRELDAIVTKLHQHGIQMHTLMVDFTVLEASRSRIDSIERAERPFQGHHIVRVEASRESERVTFGSGSVIVPTGQPLGSLAAYLLEPESDDGLVAWGFLDGHLNEGQPFPILRIPSAVELPLRPLSP